MTSLTDEELAAARRFGALSLLPAAQFEGLVRLAKLAELRDTAQAAVDTQVDHLVEIGVNYGQIAQILGISRQAVRQAHIRRNDKEQTRDR